MSKNKSTMYVYLGDETWNEYKDSCPNNVTRYKTVTETKSGYKVIAPLASSSKVIVYKMIGDTSVLVQASSPKNIEKSKQVEQNGSWLQERKSKLCFT